MNSATRGTVVAVGPAALTIEWAGANGRLRSRVGAEHAEDLGYGYATTVPYLRGVTLGGSAVLPVGPRVTGPCMEKAGQTALLVLGDHLELGARSAATAGAWVTVGGPGPLGAVSMAARRRAAITELATSWPDEEMLRARRPAPVATRRGQALGWSCRIRCPRASTGARAVPRAGGGANRALAALAGAVTSARASTGASIVASAVAGTMNRRARALVRRSPRWPG